MWKNRLWYAALVLSSLIAYIAADKREALVLLGMLVLMPLLSAALQIAAMQGIGVSCHVQGVCRMGQDVGVRFHLDRKSRMPLGPVWITFVFENILYGEKRSVRACLQPDEEKELSFVYLFRAEDCGNVKTRVLSMECRDVLGLSVFRRPVRAEAETLVYPPKIRLNTELVQRPEAKSFGDLYDQQKKGQDVSEVSGLRDYVPGDTMNSIHWKLSGKLNRLIVREFGNPSNYHTLILYEVMGKAGEVKIPNAYNNGVLALTAAMSQGLLELNLEHNVGRILNSVFQTVPVCSTDTCEQMQVSLLCMPVEEDYNSADTVYSFFKGNISNEYTKIIYITPHYEENTARQLAREADLTVIQVAGGKGMDYTASAGYTLISVDVDTYQEAMQNVTI